MVKHILCFSGGKDSTAMLIHCIENKLPLDEILYVDCGDWMWDCASGHIQSVEEKLNVNITILDITHKLKEGFSKWGFPSFFNRWCTGEKREAMKKYLRNKYPDDEIIQYIGYTSDESKRTGKKLYSSFGVEYPLVDAGITGEMAHKICKEYGFDFGGVYKHHSHFNCWCCPLQKVGELRHIYIYMPELWDRLREMQKQTDGYYQNGKTIFEFEQKFWKEKQEQLKKQRLDARTKKR